MLYWTPFTCTSQKLRSWDVLWMAEVEQLQAELAGARREFAKKGGEWRSRND